MTKSRKYTDKEFDELQKTRYEIKKLKRQISSLRKQISRTDIDRYQNLKDLLHKHNESDLNEKLDEERQKMEKMWECHKCKEGFLKIHILPRRDGVYYYRKCSECNQRTKTQILGKEVEGIKD